MKRIAFDKLTRFGYRAGFPGYLLEHSAHPTRRFVIARTSQPFDFANPLAGCKLNKDWGVYDWESGASLAKLGFGYCKTMARAEDHARAHLFTLGEEKIAKHIEGCLVKVATLTLKGES